MPSAIWHLLLRSGSAHYDQELAVEVARRRTRRMRRWRRKRALIKSNNPHLAAGKTHNRTKSVPCSL